MYRNFNHLCDVGLPLILTESNNIEGCVQKKIIVILHINLRNELFNIPLSTSQLL